MSRDISLHKTSLCGYRQANEDIEKYRMNLATNGEPIEKEFAPVDFFALADGHGGSKVAEFVVPLLEKYLMNNKLTYPLPHKYICKVYHYIQKKLIDHENGIANAAGCTALVVIRYMDENKIKNLQVINLGDCRAVLSRKGLALPLSKDHKPLWPDEKRRIDYVNAKHNTNQKIHYDAGDWRIGDLSVSRSFGDLDNTPYVTHIPDSFHYQLTDDDEFVLLACDGCYDVISNHDAVNFIRDHLYNNHIEFYQIEEPHKYPSRELVGQKNIARLLAEFCLAKGTTDNVSVMIVFFNKK